MSETVLFYVPMKPRTPEKLASKFCVWFQGVLASTEKAGYRFTVVSDSDGTGDSKGDSHAHRASRICGVRNSMLDRYPPTCSDWVVWVDADLTGSSPDVVPRLIELSRHHRAVVAPSVWVESANGSFIKPSSRPIRGVADLDRQLRWYDTSGFVHGKSRALHVFPFHAHATQHGVLVPVDGSVGCFHVAPSALYREGVKFGVPLEPTFTEHYPLCQDALTRGYRLYWSVVDHVYHAYLPSYGEAFH